MWRSLPPAHSDDGGYMEISGIGCLEHLFNHGKGRGRARIKPAQAAHSQHKHVELEGHFGCAVVDNAHIAAHEQLVGVAAAFLTAGTNNVINLLVIFGHIKLLAGQRALRFIIP